MILRPHGLSSREGVSDKYIKKADGMSISYYTAFYLFLQIMGNLWKLVR